MRCFAIFIARLLARIAGIQQAPDYTRNCFLLDLEARLLADYSLVIQREELNWFQKSRIQWMQLGDRNTWFYQVSTISRRKANKIEVLKLDNGVFCSDPDLIKAHARTYFVNLFGLSETDLIPLAVNSDPSLPEVLAYYGPFGS